MVRLDENATELCKGVTCNTNDINKCCGCNAKRPPAGTLPDESIIGAKWNTGGDGVQYLPTKFGSTFYYRCKPGYIPTNKQACTQGTVWCPDLVYQCQEKGTDKGEITNKDTRSPPAACEKGCNINDFHNKAKTDFEFAYDEAKKHNPPSKDTKPASDYQNELKESKNYTIIGVTAPSPPENLKGKTVQYKCPRGYTSSVQDSSSYVFKYKCVKDAAELYKVVLVSNNTQKINGKNVVCSRNINCKGNWGIPVLNSDLVKDAAAAVNTGITLLKPHVDIPISKPAGHRSLHGGCCAQPGHGGAKHYTDPLVLAEFIKTREKEGLGKCTDGCTGTTLGGTCADPVSQAFELLGSGQHPNLPPGASLMPLKNRQYIRPAGVDPGIMYSDGSWTGRATPDKCKWLQPRAGETDDAVSAGQNTDGRCIPHHIGCRLGTCNNCDFFGSWTSINQTPIPRNPEVARTWGKGDYDPFVPSTKTTNPALPGGGKLPRCGDVCRSVCGAGNKGNPTPCPYLICDQFRDGGNNKLWSYSR